MRVPAVAVAAAFAGGIVFGQWQPVAQRVSSRPLLGAGFALALLFIFVGIPFLKVYRFLPAAVISLGTWAVLGVVAARIAQQPRPANHVLSLLEARALDLKTPLRWHGRLRDEPARLPWGVGYEINLSGVESEGRLLPASGGLRLSFAPQTKEEAAPDVHAGDEVSVLTQARRPQNYRDDGAFDRRAYLEQQNIHVVATLRAPELMERVSVAEPTPGIRLARARRRLREQVDILFASNAQVAGVLRAILLGDRSFVDRAESTDFQKTGVFHVLVVAGLHVGALGFFLFWVGRKLRLSPLLTALLTLSLLLAYVTVVEQRPPVLRAAVMTAIVVLGGMFFRRLELLNSAAVAALLLLIAKPLAVRDSSFQLTFLAIGCIAGLAAPWLERTVQPYVRALRGWRDITRDAANLPGPTQFRIDLRALSRWTSSRLPLRLSEVAENSLATGISFSLRVWELLVITMALQLGMLPLMARDFHRITLDAPLVNLAAVPLTGVVVPLGFLTIGTGLLFPALGKLVGVPLAWATLLLLRVVQWFAQFPQWSYRIPGPPSWLVVIFLLGGVLLAMALRIIHPGRRLLARVACGVLGAGALAIALFPFGPKWSKGKLEVTVLDVGQGDSLFVVSPHGRTLLIDGGGAFGGFPGHEEHNGPDPGEDAVSPYLWSRGFQKLDTVALTHAHQDHIGGLTAILENFRVGSLLIGREVSSAAFSNLEQLAHERKIPVVHEIRGRAFSWDGVEAQFLWPEVSPEEIAPSAKNNDSLVLRLQYGDRSVMLPGDAEKQTEREILAENSEAIIHADVLKIGHHGSKNSTTPEFLGAVRPQIAVISAGEDNPYGHPSPELLERLEEAGLWVLRTDRDGAVHVLTDGRQLQISCYVACLEPGRVAFSRQAQAPDENHRGKQQ